jgi:hypothetical protein
MPTIIYAGKLWITVNEVMQLMDDFRNDMENKRQECLTDIKKADLLPIIKDMSTKITNIDYDMFIESIEKNVKQYQEQLEQRATEIVIQKQNKNKGE